MEAPNDDSWSLGRKSSIVYRRPETLGRQRVEAAKPSVQSIKTSAEIGDKSESNTHSTRRPDTEPRDIKRLTNGKRSPKHLKITTFYASRVPKHRPKSDRRRLQDMMGEALEKTGDK